MPLSFKAPSADGATLAKGHVPRCRPLRGWTAGDIHLSISPSVGAGIPDGPGRNAPWTRQGCRVLRNGCAFAPMRRATVPGAARRHTQVPPYEHGRTAPHGLRAGTSSDTVRHKAAVHHPLTGWGRRPSALPGDAPSADGAMDDWGFRPLRRAGVSLAAASGSFARCDGRPKALPLETAIWATRHRLARGVGEEFCGRARPSFAAILDVWQEAGPQLWRKRPGDTRRHTGGKLPHRKKSSKTFIFFYCCTTS